ncbi:MAG: mechanosensitive ion channel family protein [Myxococcales bacterium]|nr:mechanosensitive ion channel family protein [Myxococcales bacterium]
MAYAALVLMLVALATVDSFRKTYDLTEGAVEGIIRAAKRVVALTGVVLIFAALTARNPMYFVGGLGAFMAVIILGFRDSILGLVASIQIASRKMVKSGDWIQMPSHDADGDVLDITLNSVKVQNFDKTITTIPTYALLSESFRNLGDIPGRRIKRAILIDIHSVKACTPEMLEGYARIELLRDYIQTKKEDLERYNIGRDVGASALNGRRLTNIGTLRAYVEAYLAKRPDLSNEMTCLVRQLDPGTLGLPIEIYAFCIETGFKNYEAVQADIFDHVLSILPEFELRAFQNVTNPDAHSKRMTAPPAEPGASR